MVTEEIVVVVLVVMISFLYVKRGKHGTAISILPLAVLPACCLLGYFLSSALETYLMSSVHWYMLFVIVGLVLGGLLMGGVSRSIRNKGTRRMYMLLCGGFTVFFAFAELLNRVR